MRKQALVDHYKINQVICVTNVGDDSWHEVKGVTYQHYPLKDGKDIPDTKQCVDRIVLNLDLGGRTLVYCYSGLNRCALVSCLVALRMTDMTGEELVQLVKSVRGPNAFNNPYFRRYIEGEATQQALLFGART